MCQSLPTRLAEAFGVAQVGASGTTFGIAFVQPHNEADFFIYLIFCVWRKKLLKRGLRLKEKYSQGILRIAPVFASFVLEKSQARLKMYARWLPQLWCKQKILKHSF